MKVSINQNGIVTFFSDSPKDIFLLGKLAASAKGYTQQPHVDKSSMSFEVDLPDLLAVIEKGCTK